MVVQHVHHPDRELHQHAHESRQSAVNTSISDLNPGFLPLDENNIFNQFSMHKKIITTLHPIEVTKVPCTPYL